MRKIIFPILFLRMHIFKFYAYTLLLICCLTMNIIGTLGAALNARLFVCRVWSIMSRAGVLLILQIYIKVEGKENISTKPCIYISKHQSMLETLIFHGLIKKICFVMKQELLDKPIFGKTNIFAEGIGIDRSQGISAVKKMLSDGRDRVNNKSLSIVIFPEGTRVPIGEYPKFHKSAMKLAKTLDIPLVPVSHNFGVFFGRKQGDFIKPGLATISFGKSIDPKNHSVEDLTTICHEMIKGKTKSLGG